MCINSRIAAFVLCFGVVVIATAAQNNGGFDHRAHSVPGADQTVYDIDDDGFETVHLDGVNSHSHFFDSGPPIVSGVIESFRWTDITSNNVFCNTMICDEAFPVGETHVSLTVEDNTGDVVSDTMIVTVLPRSAITETPRIDAVSPNQGQATGGNTVTIDGAFLYRDAIVFFGTLEALDIQHVNLGRITCKAPGGVGSTTITVVSSIGTSNGVQYNFQEGRGNIPIRFQYDTWTNSDGSEFVAQEITSITIGRDHRYYMGSLTGYVTVASVNRALVVESSCKGAFMGNGRSIAGIGFNPIDPSNRVLVSTNTFFHRSEGARWDNAKIEAVNIGGDGCPVRGPIIISGLPVSNHDHGSNAIAFLGDGRMLVSVGSFSNAGASKAGDGIGGVPENPLSASIVVADYLRPGFNGEILYDQYENPATSLVVNGDVEPYVVGIRNCFGLVLHSNGQVYATDNGPNTGFGASSVTCTEDGPDPESKDKLLRLIQGNYYGHANRNRGRFDPRQCTYRYIDEPASAGYSRPIGTMTSSTDGIIEYRANTFAAALKGDLLMSKVAFGASGLVWRAELTGNGQGLKSQPYHFYDESGVSMTMGLYGEIVMPQLKKYRVLALRPDEPGANSVEVIAVHPSKGPTAGGNELLISGHFLNAPDLVVLVGGQPCINLMDAHYQHVRCTAPAGVGKVSVVASTGGVTSISYGHEYEYLG